MSRRSLLALLATTLCVGTLVPWARAEERAPVRLEALVPDTTLAFFGVHDLGPGLARRFGETGLGRIAREPEMAAYLQGLAAEMRQALDTTERASAGGPLPGVSPLAAGALRLLEGLDGEAAVAWISTRDDGVPVLVGVLDFGPHLADFLAFLQRSASRAPEADGPTLRTGSSGEFTLSIGGYTERYGVAVGTLYGVAVGTALYLSNDAGWVAARTGEPFVAMHPPLEGSVRWVVARNAVDLDGATAFGFLEVPATGDLASAATRSAWVHTAIRIVGDVAPGLVTYAARVSGTVVEERLSFADARRGLLSLFSGAEDARPIPLVPRADPVLALTGHLTMERLLLRVLAVLGRLGLDSEASGALDWLKSRPRLDSVEDVLRGLTGEISIGLAMPETGGLYPETVAALGLVDPTAFEPLFVRATERLCEELSIDGAARWTTRALPFHGTVLHLVEEVVGDDRGPTPGLPTWMVLGDRLWLAPVPHVLKEVVLRAEEARVAGSGAPSRGALRSAGTPLARPPRPLAVPGASATILLDAGGIENLLYDTAAPLLQSFLRPVLARLPVHGDPVLLPPARVLRPHLEGLSISLSSGPVGPGARSLKIETRGPLPILGALIVAGALAELAEGKGQYPEPEELVGDPLAAGPSDDPIVATTATMLRISAAIDEYAGLHGVLPASLADLVTQAHLLGHVPSDRWARPILWRPDDAGREGLLVSCGPDGLPDTDDDVTLMVEPFAK